MRTIEPDWITMQSGVGYMPVDCQGEIGGMIRSDRAARYVDAVDRDGEVSRATGSPADRMAPW